MLALSHLEINLARMFLQILINHHWLNIKDVFSL